MNCITQKLMNDYLEDKDYKEYLKLYSKEKYIDDSLVERLLKRHIELYYIFLKINIAMYKYNTKGLKKEIREYNYHNGKDLTLEDIHFIFKYYYKNFTLCKNTIKTIVKYELRPKVELELLKQILERKIDMEITPLYKIEN